ncbi:malectin domain-containing carbohydrate-binding protein [Cyclobacterium marinum]|uniref:Carbohydrate-binding CenC domain protein n=1 Tax=Cyclobacterium marinum (strain ATCC 25205 / DSM 745 / LMG 13164 / NCIMB 1802) TaxID=880070 RepID=G0J229_CYCMS|nr:malectin domain-containing carbohydrate-binding protein [Cyclobacterium marinum]AEL24538.1 Carbohydrate-binding CenC domain protein [Cyclobacterium marinum DSM 745]MBR9777627.1 T9SS type A sorting domain-containing protein [Cytophagales bacterium]|tara:strand:+ start:38797 stop:43377 length:4581 start_codon:yes stop_codon:yes gene_type:complete
MNKPLLRFAFCFSLILLSIKASATDYYFSTEIGNDSRSTTEAQNPDTPWKSINKLNAIFSSLKPGDAIYLKRGDVFYGTIKATKSGSPGNPIKIDAYGSGAKPIITSFEKVTGWKSIGNGRYESTNTFSSYETNIVTIDNQLYENGRFPNSDAENGGYLTVSSFSGNSSVNSEELSGAPNFSNGEIVIRKNQWILDRHLIKSNSGSTVNYSGSGAYSPSTGFGFFIQNHLSTLDKFGEWFYSNTRKLNVYFGNTNPNNHSVSVSTLENLFIKSYNIDHLLIQSLHFKGANKDAIYIGEGSDIVLNNTDIEYSGQNGITSLNIKDLIIQNCRVNYSLNIGLNLRYGNDNAVIKDNIIENTFPFPGGGQNQDNNGNGIFVSGNSITIENNIVKSTGFNGIHFNGNNISIKNNLIQEFCLLKNDCGGIYTFGGNSVSTFSNRVIENNIIIDGLATNNGTPYHDVQNYHPQGSGIFLDDNANGVSIIKNTIANTEYSGFKASNVFNVTVKENIFYNSYAQALIGNSERGTDTRNLTFSNNVLFSKETDQYTYRINTYKEDIKSFGTFDQNYFARPLGDDHSIYVAHYTNNNKLAEIKNLDDWRDTFNKDNSSSTFRQDKYKQFSLKNLIGELLYNNLSFLKGIDDFYCNDCTESWEPKGILDGSIKIKSPGYSSALARIGSVQKNKTYVAKFKAKSNKTGFLRVALRYAGTPWEVISPSTAIELNTESQEFSVLLKPYENVSEPVIMFISDVGNWEYWIDDLEIREADVELTDPDDIFLFEYNASKSNKSIFLDGTFKDVKGNTFSGDYQIEPYSSALLVRTSDAVAPPKNEPEIKQEVKITSLNTNGSYELGEKIALIAEITPNNENISKVAFYSGDNLIGSATDQPYKVTWGDGNSGEHQINAVIINNSNNVVATSAQIPIKINTNSTDSGNENPVSNGYSLYLNIGSNDAEVYEGNKFIPLSQTEVTTGRSNSLELENEAGTIFESISFNEELSYKIPVPNGFYTVKTYHQEVHFGLNGVAGRNGKRVFDLSIEGETKYKDLDLYALSKNQKIILTHENIEVKDGSLDLNLLASANNAIISAISIVERGVSTETPEPTDGAKFINVGGITSENYNGDTFVSDYIDKHFSSSGISENTSASKQPLFHTTRFAKNLIYTIPVKNGTYRVKTYHIENYFGVTHPDGKAGMRVFDIFIQNELVKNDLDLYARSGNQETDLIFNDILVKNGELKIELKASVNNAIMSGIAIIPMSGFYDDLETDSFFINVGSDTDTDYQGVNFVSEDSKVKIPSGSYLYNVPASSTDKLFQSNRYGKSLNFEFPVSNGEYTVITYHNENYFGEITSKTGANRRVFDINIENETVKKNVDLYLENSNKPVTLRFENIKVTDGILNLNLEGVINNALVSGIAVFPSEVINLGNSNLRQLVTETEELSTLNVTQESSINTDSKNKIYPNPAISYAILQTGQDLGEFYISIHNFNGQLISFVNAEDIKNSDGNYEIPVQNLRQGVYIVTLTSNTGVIERMRLAVTP